LGAKWRALTPEEKQPYLEMQQKDEERVQSELVEYKRMLLEEASQGKYVTVKEAVPKSQVQKRGPPKPRGKKSAYLAYCEAVHPATR